MKHRSTVVLESVSLPVSDEVVIARNDTTYVNLAMHHPDENCNRHRMSEEEEDVVTASSTPTPLENHHHHRTTMIKMMIIAFGMVGLLNNCAYVIMIANAKYISEGGVAAVYICNIVPGLLVQITAPYWFDHISYQIRLRCASISMAVAFLLVSYFSHRAGTYSNHVVLMGQLLGVALISFQCGLGEASLLALAGKWDSSSSNNSSDDLLNNNNNNNEESTMVDNDNHHHHHHHTKQSKGYYLSAFAMGTGMAGPIGFLWKIAGNEWIGMSVSASLFMAALVLSTTYGILCTKLVQWSQPHHHLLDTSINTNTTTDDHRNTERQQYTVIRTEPDEIHNSHELAVNIDTPVSVENLDMYQPPSVENVDDDRDGLIRESSADVDLLPQVSTLPALSDLSILERFRLLMRMCWVYMIPLFVVYTAEYACQAGAWTTIGFPTVTDRTARIQFFERSNWLYQAGVFVSRSTGSLLTIHIVGLWIMPAIQVVNLIIFATTARTGIQVPRSIFYHQSTLLSLSFFTGLLGGAVYVHGYNRIVRDVPPQYTEFAVASTSVAVSLGVLVADIMGLYLQSCLYQSNGLDGAVVQCPL